MGRSRARIALVMAVFGARGSVVLGNDTAAWTAGASCNRTARAATPRLPTGGFITADVDGVTIRGEMQAVSYWWSGIQEGCIASEAQNAEWQWAPRPAQRDRPGGVRRRLHLPAAGCTRAAMAFGSFSAGGACAADVTAAAPNVGDVLGRHLHGDAGPGRRRDAEAGHATASSACRASPGCRRPGCRTPPELRGPRGAGVVVFAAPMASTDSTTVRRTFLDYFAKQGHKPVASASLVPHNDPTLLFTNAGMNQFKDYFTGKAQPPFPRATTAQKCVRAGGKHNDLENVGRTARHHTFFEMLGNFSFGDYFKPDAIAFAHELLTKDYAIDPKRLVYTVHEIGRRGARAVEEGRRRRRRPRHLAGRQGQLLGDGRDRPLRPVQRDPLPAERRHPLRRGGRRAQVPGGRLRLRSLGRDLEPGVHAVRAGRHRATAARCPSRRSTPAWASSGSARC